MLSWVLKKILGTKNERELARIRPIVAKINAIEQDLQQVSDATLIAKTAEMKERYQKGETLDQLLPEAFAVVKNCARRFAAAKRQVEVRGQMMTWEMVHFDVQLIGGMVLHGGRIAEMGTGEGKTLVATLPVYLNALTGKGVHVITVNDYLASRDAEWMGEIYRFLGLTVGCIQRDQSPDVRRQMYQCDITYGTNSEFGFDYLRDNGMATTREDQVQRGHAYAIVDEVDSILIDEARVPLIIAGPVSVSSHQYDKFKPVIERLVQAQTVECNRWANEAKRLIDSKGDMEEAGRLLYKVKLSMPQHRILARIIEDGVARRAMDDAELVLYQDPRRIDYFKLREEAYFSIDVKSHDADLTERGREYLNPNDPKMFLIPDIATEFHEIEAKGGTAEEKARRKQEAQVNYDDASERIHNISQLLKAYCIMEKDRQYVVQDNKVVIVDEFTGRPMPGRRWSDGLHQAVEAKEGVQIDRETQTMATITIQNYFRLYEKLAGMTGTAETEANEFKDIYKLEVIVIPPNRKISRVDHNDSIYKTRRAKYNAIIQEIKAAHEHGQPVLVGTVAVDSSEVLSRMLKREGIPHTVLNARYHQQEAEIVARAGQKGAVTIATNMAGRGTDIKLGPGVHELGGLYVIGTERHEARRIDRQLRGRCARQGDPGVSKFYVSFEDDLMTNFGDSRRISGIMTALGMTDDEELEHPWLNKSVESAQKRVEQRNYSVRRYTLQYDDVMNQQRMVIYEWRNAILDTETPRTEVFEAIEKVVGDECSALLTGASADPEEFLQWVNTTFPLGLEKGDLPFDQGSDAVEKAVLQKITEAYELKIKFEQAEAIKHIERSIVLTAIDKLWQEHLYAMDQLRTGISLYQHAQKDPLIEYKKEAFKMFEQLMGTINAEIVNNSFRSASSLEAIENFLHSLPTKMVHDLSGSGLEFTLPLPGDFPGQELPPQSTPPAEEPKPSQGGGQHHGGGQHKKKKRR
ncbi:preprotein translocase subunit SecA [Verrucomicrobia bacterium LW23]|nr:preprotein translocase subunit SecA [Verrucomicrobia bacterium LW23]